MENILVTQVDELSLIVSPMLPMGAQEMDWHVKCLANGSLLMLGIVRKGGLKKIEKVDFC